MARKPRASQKRPERAVDGPGNAPSKIWRLLEGGPDAHFQILDHAYLPQRLLLMCRHVPRVVLDVGCFVGATGSFLKRLYPACRVIGIEPGAKAAAAARSALDEVHQATIEGFDYRAAGLAEGTLDTVILADVLEHIHNPWGELSRLRRMLSPDAQLLISIPNVRNLHLMSGLAEGRWSYEPSGLLDLTHIRFFTRTEIAAMLADTGYRIAAESANYDHRLADLVRQAGFSGTRDIQLGRLVLRDATPQEALELATLQFYVVAQPI